MADLWPITLAGILMDNVPDADGVRWRVHDVDGWDAAPVRADDSERTGRHGGFGSGRLWAARRLTVLGRAHCPDIATAYRVRDLVASAMPGLGSAELVMHEPVAKSLEVVLAPDSKPESSRPRNGAPFRVAFQIPLVAHDPFKRATTTRTTVVGAGATVAATNDGTAAADLLVTLTSGGTVVLSAGGVTLTTGVLPAGALIDTGSTSVTAADGSDLMTLVVMPPLMPRLPAGGGNVTQAGTAGLSIEHFDTYA